jgi:hypothetical protein
MKISILSSSHIKYSLEQSIAKAAEPGYDAIDLLQVLPPMPNREKSTGAVERG